MDLVIQANPFGSADIGEDMIAWINRPAMRLHLPPLVSGCSDREGHVVLSIRPASSDACFAKCARKIDSDSRVQLNRDDLAIVECKPQDEAGSHAHAVEAVRAFAGHALRSGWRVWHGFSGLRDPMLEVFHGEGGLLWERHDEPLILIFLPPEDTRRAA
jgi:hypothetical protein